MRIFRAVAATLSCLCAACAVHPVAPAASTGPGAVTPAAGTAAPLYSARERASLFGCSALTDTAMIVADMKHRGVSLQDVKGFYAGRPNSDLTLATADKVYDDKVGNIWDYATVFFGDCATRVSLVPRERTGPASFCMLNSMIAASAQASREAHVPIEKVEQYFAGFPGDQPRAIITRVYAQSQSRAEAHAEAWNACMAPISGG